MHGPEMKFGWLTDLGKINNFSVCVDNVCRAHNDNIAGVLKFYLASVNNGA